LFSGLIGLVELQTRDIGIVVLPPHEWQPIASSIINIDHRITEPMSVA
jgi:hypothetical protein